MLMTFTTSDMKMREENCFKIQTDNIFGPDFLDIKSHPTDTNNFYAVGKHIDYIGGVNTGFILHFEVLDTYVTNIIKYKTLNSTFTTTGDTPGFASLEFDKTGDNMAIGGIFKDSSQTYMGVLNIDKTISTCNWMKYFKTKSTSTKALQADEIEINYDSNSQNLFVLIHTTDKSIATYPNMVNIYSMKMSDGSLNWELQFSDYSNEKFGRIYSTLNPNFKELTLFFTNSAYDYYHFQSIDLATGTMLTNIQTEIMYHYQIEGITAFTSQDTNFESNDILATSVDGYIMKFNMRKANLEVTDKTSLLRPLLGIHYNNFTISVTTPTDLEMATFIPSGDFLEEETAYEVNSLGYTQKDILVPTLTDATSMAIHFSEANNTVTVPNTGMFLIGQPYTKDNANDGNISLSIALYDINE